MKLKDYIMVVILFLFTYGTINGMHTSNNPDILSSDIRIMVFTDMIILTILNMIVPLIVSFKHKERINKSFLFWNSIGVLAFLLITDLLYYGNAYGVVAEHLGFNCVVMWLYNWINKFIFLIDGKSKKIKTNEPDSNNNEIIKTIDLNNDAIVNSKSSIENKKIINEETITKKEFDYKFYVLIGLFTIVIITNIIFIILLMKK